MRTIGPLAVLCCRTSPTPEASLQTVFVGQREAMSVGSAIAVAAWWRSRLSDAHALPWRSR